MEESVSRRHGRRRCRAAGQRVCGVAIASFLLLVSTVRVEAFKSHVNPTAASAGGDDTTSFFSENVESPKVQTNLPISSTVRRWKEQQYAGPLCLRRNNPTETDVAIDLDKELLLVQEKKQSRANSTDSNVGVHVSSGDEVVFLAREERDEASSNAANRGAAGFSSPKSASNRLNYRRYHPSMAPVSQLLHTVTMDLSASPRTMSTKLQASATFLSTSSNSTPKETVEIPSNAMAKAEASASSNSDGQIYSEDQNVNFQEFLTEKDEASWDQPRDNVKSMLHYWKPLLQMCRLSNLPGVLVFHLVSAHLIHRVATVGNAVVGNMTPLTFGQLLRKPSMIATLLATMLITCVSMLFNDYYDTKSGVDYFNELQKAEGKSETKGSTAVRLPVSGREPVKSSLKPLISGALPRVIARQFITLLSIATLVTTMFLPGVLPKLAVLSSGIIVYYYTQYLKPKTWIKNISCAALIGASPLVTAVSTWNVISGNGGGGVSAFLKAVPSPMGRLVASLFAWSMSREIIMDIADYKGDKAVGVQTIPVRYGKRFASKVSFAIAGVMAVIAVSGPVTDLLQPSVASSSVLSPLARLGLSSVAGAWMVSRANRVRKNEGEDDVLSKQVVENTMVSALLILGSFV